MNSIIIICVWDKYFVTNNGLPVENLKLSLHFSPPARSSNRFFHFKKNRSLHSLPWQEAIRYSPAGRSVLGKTVPGVLSTQEKKIHFFSEGSVTNPAI